MDEGLQLFGEIAGTAGSLHETFRSSLRPPARGLVVDAHEAPMIEHKFAADHDAIDACAVSGEHDLVQRRVERDALNGAQIEEDDIGVIAWRKAAECAFEAQGSGASLGRRARSLSKVYPSTICRQRARLSS